MNMTYVHLSDGKTALPPITVNDLEKFLNQYAPYTRWSCVEKIVTFQSDTKFHLVITFDYFDFSDEGGKVNDKGKLRIKSNSKNEIVQLVSYFQKQLNKKGYEITWELM